MQQELLIAFIIWIITGGFFLGMGLYCILSQRGKEVAFGFWANAKTFPVEDVKGYNRVMGILWCIFGLVFILLGTPMAMGKNPFGIILAILGVMLEAIITMAIYTTVIEKKYRKK